MTRANITPRRAEVLALVLASADGISAKDIGKALGIKPGSVGDQLRTLRALHLVGPSANGGAAVKWMPLASSVEARAELQASNGKRLRAEAHRQQMRRYREKLARHREKMAEHWEAGPHRRIVCAAECDPIRSSAPVSVFELADQAA